MDIRFSRHTTSRLLCIFLAACAAATAGADGFYIRPHIQNVTVDGATLIWETPEEGVGVVEYGKPGALDQKAQESAPAKIHRVRMTGLQAGTEYGYSVKAGSDEAAATFKTAPGKIVPVTFVAVGDSRRWDGQWEAANMEAHTLQWKPDFYVNNGDLVLKGHEYDLWPQHFKRFSGLNKSYMMVTARGNHEGSMYADKENDWFGKYHELPDEGEPQLSFDWGNVHMVLLSYEDVGTPAKAEATAAWLDKDLSNMDKNLWPIVVQHFPIYCAGYGGAEDSRKENGETLGAVARVLEKHNVRVNMAGHTHIYERSYPWRNDKRNDENGVVYIVNGGDINSNYPEAWTAVHDDKRVQTKPTYTVFQCLDDRIDMRSFCVSTADKSIVQIDHFTVVRNEDVAKKAVAALKDKKDADLIKAIDDVGAMMYSPAVEALVPYLSDSNADVKRAAASALRSIGTDDAAKALAPFLGDGDVTVRREAARALEIALPKKQMDAAQQCALDPKQDEDVRASAIGALELHAKPAVAREASLAVLESDAPSTVRCRAAYAMSRIADKDDVSKLVALVKDEEDPYVLVRLGYALNHVKGNRVNLNGKGPYANSKPGTREEFVQEWLKD
jgi:3',5'-cyclic AMP phosphodiesterase CpdA